jgi:ERCC4-type nuclease
MIMPEVTIQVSARQSAKFLKKLEDIEQLKFSIIEDESADVFLNAESIIIKKSATDFILNVVDQQLADQVEKLKNHYERIFFIIEGEVFNARFHQRAFDVHWALAHMTAIQGVPVLISDSVDTSAMLVYCLAADLQHPPAAAHRQQQPKKRLGAQKYLLQGLPGVNADQAEALLKAFGSVRAIMNAEASELAAHVGADYAEKIKKLIE